MDKLKEKKAEAYDLLAQIEMLNLRLRETNQEIARLSNEPESEVLDKKE
jgi:hypothetical protein